MKGLEWLTKFFNKFLFNPKWRCVVCNKEIFDKQYFCEQCKNKLPLNNGAICQHCGRQLKQTQNYCTTCKGRLVDIDYSRSVYSYHKPINSLIKRLKYNNGRYLVQAFTQDMVNLYYKSYFNVDFITFVPMTKRAKKKRGYNQSELLAIDFCEKTGLELIECFEKVKETTRQATLNREGRLKNLKDAFKIINKKFIKDKKILIIDDVSTTGATVQVLAERLKSTGAKSVFVLTVASVPPKDGY